MVYIVATRKAKQAPRKEIKVLCKAISELDKVVADYRSLKAMKEELDEQLKACEREIIGYLDFNNKVSETGKDYTVKVSDCERNTLDKARLEADLGCLSEYYNTSHYRRLYVR